MNNESYKEMKINVISVLSNTENPRVSSWKNWKAEEQKLEKYLKDE